MRYRQLGTSRLSVSQLGFGTRLLEQTKFATPKEFDTLIENVVQTGINFFVGAGHYSGGEAEKLLGSALGPYRDKIVLATSVGVRHTKDQITISLSVPLVQAQLEQSLQHLQTDYIDVLQLHYYDPTCDLDALKTYVQELAESGIIRALGVSNFHVQELKDWDGIPIHSLQMPYNPLQREIEDRYVSFCQEKAISLLTYMPLCGGIFTAKNVLRKNLYPYEAFLSPEKIASIRMLLEELQSVAQALDMTISDLVLVWLAQKPFISSVLIGTSSLTHLQANVSALTKQLSSTDMNILERVLDTFWSKFPRGLTIPMKVENIHEVSPGKRYTNLYGSYIPVPDSVQQGDTVELNDTLGEIWT